MTLETAKKSTQKGMMRLAVGLMNHVSSIKSKFNQFLNYGASNHDCNCQGLTHKQSERGDVPGWVLVVLMTTGLVTAIWTIAAPRLSAILKNSLDAMNGIR